MKFYEVYVASDWPQVRAANHFCEKYSSFKFLVILFILTAIILLTKTTAARNEGALSYLRVRGL